MIIAHRGGKPENTLQAFEHCVVNRVDGIEFDVWKTLDEEFIVTHDAEINNRRINQLTLEEIQTLEPKIPRLYDVLNSISKISVQHHVKIPLLNVEIKPFDIAEDLAKWLQNYIACPDNKYTATDFVVTSFLHTEIDIFHRHFPEIAVGWIMASFPMDLISMIKQYPYIGVIVLGKNAVSEKYITTTISKLKTLKDTVRRNRDPQLWIYCQKNCVKTAISDAQELLDYGVDAYISDYPLECKNVII